MTEIHETRWRCDYCHNVSPVLENGELFFERKAPMGWFCWEPGTLTMVDVINFKEGISGPFHFCCAYHEILWKNKRAESAETPEEAR